MQNVVGPTLVAMATKFWQIWAIFSQNAYKSAYMPDRPDIFGTTRGDDQGGGLIFVAMATTFAHLSNHLPASLFSQSVFL